MDEELEPEIEIERRAATLKIVRELCSPLEAKAMQIESPTGLAWYSPGGPIFEVEVRGGREGSERIDAKPELGWDQPFSLFRIAHQLALSPEEWIGRQGFRSANQPIRNDPVVEALASLTSRAIEFNKVQGGYQTIPMNGEKLGEMLLAARKRQLEDAKALSDLPLGVDVSVPEAESLYVAVVPGRRLVPMGSTVIWAGVPVEEGAERVTVEFINGANGTHGPVELMQKIFSIDLADPRISAAWGVPNFVLAELLGFGVEEVRLDW